MDPLTDINVLRWHIFKRGSGGWEEEMTAHNCPFQPLACTRTVHSCCMTDAHSPTCQQLQSVPCFWRKCLPMVVPIYLIFFAYEWCGQTFSKQKHFFLPPPLNTYHIGNNVLGVMFLELLPSSLFSMDLAFHVPTLQLHLISSQILIDTFLISVCQRSISLFC